MKKTKKKTARTAKGQPARTTRAAKKKTGTTRKKATAKKKVPARRRKPSSAGVKTAEGMDLESIERLVRLMAENDLLEIEVLNGPDRKVRLSRRGDTPPPVVVAPSAAPVAPAAPPVAPTADQAAAPAAAAKPAAAADNAYEFVSPMVGTFYRAPSPESPPYVTTGEKVNSETILCIIEAMKVMNEIKAEVSGEIVDILVENGEAVEFGQPLFLIKKSG